MSRKEARVVKTHQALEIVGAHGAFAKNIATESPATEPSFDSAGNHWGFLIRQMADPENFRPAKRVPANADRTVVYRPDTRTWTRFQVRPTEGESKSPDHSQWETGLVNPQKGMSKPGAKFTKKTSVSLLPPDGRMRLFTQVNGVALLFDVTKCKVKPQYIWQGNVVSDGKWWYRNAAESSALVDATTLEEIRKAQNKAIRDQRALNWNECQVDLCSEAIIGILVPKNDKTRRLNAQYRRLILLKELGVDVPLFIASETDKISEYSVEMQEKDLGSPVTPVDRDFVQAIRALELQLLAPDLTAVSESFANDLRDELFDLISNNKTSEICDFLTAFPRAIFLKNREGETAIQFAAIKGLWDCVAHIAFTVKTDAMDRANYGRALLIATRLNQGRAAFALVSAGAAIDYKPTDGFTVVHCAVKQHNTLLLTHIFNTHQNLAANFQNTDEVASPLGLSIKHNVTEATELLFRNGFVTPVSDSAVIDLYRAKEFACVFAYLEGCVKAKKPLVSLVRALIVLSDDSSLRFLEEILKRSGGNGLVNMCDNDGVSPLSLAISLNEKNTVSLLLQYGAKVSDGLLIAAAIDNKWDCVFLCVVKIKDLQRCVAIVSELQKVAMRQHNSAAFSGIALLMIHIKQCLEQNQVESDEVFKRNSISGLGEMGYDSLTKRFTEVKNAITAKNRLEQTEYASRNAISCEMQQAFGALAMSLLCGCEVVDRSVAQGQAIATLNTVMILWHVEVLKVQIRLLSQEMIPGTVRGFSLPVIGLEKKKAKSQVLAAAKTALDTQTTLGGVFTQSARADFEVKLTVANPSLWNDSRTKRLIARSNELLQEPCVKLTAL